MAILPRERIQTAREWMNIVTGRKDKVRLIRQTPTDDLNKVLTLGIETNEYLSAEPVDSRTRRKPTVPGQSSGGQDQRSRTKTATGPKMLHGGKNNGPSLCLQNQASWPSLQRSGGGGQLDCLLGNRPEV